MFGFLFNRRKTALEMLEEVRMDIKRMKELQKEGGNLDLAIANAMKEEEAWVCKCRAEIDERVTQRIAKAQRTLYKRVQPYLKKYGAL